MFPYSHIPAIIKFECNFVVTDRTDEQNNDNETQVVINQKALTVTESLCVSHSLLVFSPHHSLRWPSFRTSDHLNQPASSLQISSQSAGQLSLLQKFSLLRLTAIMEKYSMSNKHGWTWWVYRLPHTCIKSICFSLLLYNLAISSSYACIHYSGYLQDASQTERHGKCLKQLIKCLV